MPGADAASGALPKDGAPSSATYSGARSSSAGYPSPAKAPTSSAGKPLTLRAAVKACNVEGVRLALQKLEGNTEAALDATDGAGRTVLHVCAATPLRDGTGDVVSLLLKHKARTDARDANKQEPLHVALAAISTASEVVDMAPAVAAVSHLLAARACASRN